MRGPLLQLQHIILAGDEGIKNRGKKYGQKQMEDHSADDDDGKKLLGWSISGRPEKPAILSVAHKAFVG
ncbi:MAG: hypothetical protein WBN92_07120 [Terriglobia bacterium]